MATGRRPRDTVVVGVTRNESPGCARDRSASGREFTLRGLPACAEGARLYRYHKPGRTLTLDTERLSCRSSRVTVRGGYVKMTIREGSPADTPRCSGVRCPLSVVRAGGRVRMVVDLRPVAALGKKGVDRAGR